MRLAFFGVLGVATAISVPARAAVTVTRNRPEVEHKTFEPGHPPPELQKSPEESAITVCEFDVRVGFNIQPGETRRLANGKQVEPLVITNVQVTTGLKITVWLPENVTAKLKAHEEGHLQIAEKIYSDRADKAAHAAAALMDGKRLQAEAPPAGDLDKAVAQTIDEANKKVYQAYLERTADYSARVNDIYDEITNHARRLDVDEKPASAEAFARTDKEDQSAATRSATRPTNPPPRLEKEPLKIGGS